jgi:hypothetical protein
MVLMMSKLTKTSKPRKRRIKPILRDVRNFLTEWGLPIVVASVFNLAIYVVADRTIGPMMQFVQDVRTIAESIERDNHAD